MGSREEKAERTEPLKAGSDDLKTENGENEDAFSFLQETIKPKPVSRKRTAGQLAAAAICGLLFGLCACAGFYMLRPWAQRTFREEPREVEVPEDVENAEEPENQQNQSEEENQENSVQEDPEAGEPGTEEPEPVIPVLNAQNFQEMVLSLHEIVKEAEKSIVAIRQANEYEWMTEEESGRVGISGVIAADNGQELLILSDNGICQENVDFTVTFANKKQYRASLKVQDKSRGLAVLAVNRSEISEDTWDSIKIAVLGNSYSAAEGDPVIALGNLFGYRGGSSYGIVSSKAYDEIFYDAGCDVIATDIGIEPGGTGFLVNQEGEIWGLIRERIWGAESSNTAKALAISDLKPALELLLNGERVPYVGIYGTTVTEEVSHKQNMPIGVYVTQVKEDSPAMAAGIQNGDILIKVEDTDVSGMTSYEKAVLDCTAGQPVMVQGKRRGADGYVDVMFTVVPENLE